MRTILPIAALLCSGCLDGFTGEKGALWFDTPLNRDFQPFTPALPVAQGTHLTFTAVSTMPYEGTRHDPEAQATVSGVALATEDAGVDLWTGWAASEGTGSLRWTGNAADDFELFIAPATSIDLVDPLAYYADLGATPRHPQLPAPGHDVVIAPGAWIYFELVPRSVGGVGLAFEPGWITVDGGVEFSVDGGSHGIDIFAPDAGAVTTSFTVTAGDSGVSETYTLHTPADVAAEAARLDLEAVEVVSAGAPTTYFVLKATVHRPDGGVLWAPPVDWQLPPGVSDVQAKNGGAVMLNLTHRNDVRMVLVNVQSAVASVSYQGLDASVTLTLPLSLSTDGGTPAGTMPVTPPPGGCLGCSSGSGALAGLALLLLFARRRRI